MRIAVCEDATADAQIIVSALEQYALARPQANCFISVFSNASELLESGEGFDCYLLDVLMNGKNGIELAQELRRRGDGGRVLFLTSSPDYALPAFGVHAADYLLKPISTGELFRALDAAEEGLALRRLRPSRPFVFRTPGGLRTVCIQDILYVEIMGHTPFFHLTGEVVRGSELRISFEASVAPLIESGCFLRPHRSYFINALHVVSLTSQSIRLDNGASIPVTRMRSAATKARYLEYLDRAQRST